MQSCLNYICCCLANKSNAKTNTNDKDKINGFEQCFLDEELKEFRFKNGVYVLKEQIGEGAFSQVFKVFNRSKNRHEVLKKLTVKESIDEYLSEYNILVSIKHDFIVQFYDCLILDGSMCFLMEIAEQGSLQNYLDNPYSQQFSASILLGICEGIFQGISYLQSRNILHRDLKPDNILLSKNQAKIADLGLSKFIISKLLSTNVGNALYAAPEKNNHQGDGVIGYGLSSDIYSAGLIMCQLLLKLKAIQMAEISFLKKKSYLDNIPLQLKDLLNSLISNSPLDRPSCDSVIQEIRSMMSNQEIIRFIEDRYKGFITIQSNKTINLQNNYENSNISQNQGLEVPLMIGEKEEPLFNYNINTNTDDDIPNEEYKSENEQWFEQNFTAGAVAILRFKNYNQAIQQFEKLLKIEVRDELLIQKKIVMIEWLMKKKNFNLLGLFTTQRSEQDYQKAKEYSEQYLKIDPQNSTMLSILVLSMIKLKMSEFEILILVEKLIKNVFFGGVSLFMTLNDVQKYIHACYASNIANSCIYFNQEIILGCSLFFFTKNQQFYLNKIEQHLQDKQSKQSKVINVLINGLKYQNNELQQSPELFNPLFLINYLNLNDQPMNLLYLQAIQYIGILYYKQNNYLPSRYEEVEQHLQQAYLQQEDFYTEINRVKKSYLDD